MLTPEQKAVKRGVALLDKYEPKWFKKIDASSFKLSNEEHCVLGQVYGEFFDGLKDLAERAIQKESIKLTNESVLELDAYCYGFNIHGESNEMWDRVGQQWLRAAARRMNR